MTSCFMHLDAEIGPFSSHHDRKTHASDKAARRLPVDHRGLAERVVYGPIFPVAHGRAEYGAERRPVLCT